MKSVHHPCPNCGSSDALVEYEDGNYCFACKNKSKGETVTEAKLSTGSIMGFKDRGIFADTCKKYGVQAQGTPNKVDKQIYPYFNKQGERVGSKVRELPKSFKVEGKINNSVALFGQQLFSSGGKAITVFEGELDALAGYQMTGSLFPCVSLPNGSSSAVASIKSNLEYLESFDKVVLCFDNDEAGASAIEEVVPLFSVGKVRVMHLKFNDACDYLKNDQAKMFARDWHSAALWTPEDIVCSDNMLERIKNQKEVESVEYPWEGLNELTQGLRKSELVTVTAPSGIGKTQVLKEIAYNITKQKEDVRIGTLFLEEQPEDSARGIMSIHANKRLHLKDIVISEEELDQVYQESLGKGNYFFYENFGESNIDKILARIRYYATGLDCEYIFLDHITYIVSAQTQTDERKALDEISTKLKNLTIELDICIIAVVHLNRAGQIRGSEGIEQVSNIVLHLQRDKTNIDKDISDTTKVTVWKNRFCGDTGVACYLKFDQITGRLTETTQPANMRDEL